MNMKRLFLVLLAPALLTACSSTKTVRVAVPPRVDLRPYPSVGLVGFTSNANSDLERMSTQKFLQEVQDAQPGTRVVELGSEAEVLASVGGRNWDAKTLRAVGEQHGVDVLVVGRLNVEKAKPQVHLSSVWKSLNAKSQVNAALTARLIETGTGATMWTRSSEVTTDVAHLNLSGKGQGNIGVRDAESAYGELVSTLVCTITDDFREHYVWRKVPKDQAYADVRD
jgi:hypothetical protein